MRRICLVLAICLLPYSASAEPPTPQAVAPVVARLTEVLFRALADRDEVLQRALFTPKLAELATPERWARQRAMIEDRIGPTPTYTPHKVTWYPEDKLYAAVAFAAEIKARNAFVCGTAVWEMPDGETIGLARLEENIVAPEVLERLPDERAAQTLADWYCPPELIARLLALSKP